MEMRARMLLDAGRPAEAAEMLRGQDYLRRPSGILRLRFNLPQPGVSNIRAAPQLEHRVERA